MRLTVAPTCITPTWEWPSFHWWVSLSASDQGAWVSGLGAFAAVAVALGLALRESSSRRADRKYSSTMLAMRITPVLVEISLFLNKILRKIDDCAPEQRLELFRRNAVLWKEKCNSIQPESFREAFEHREVALPNGGSKGLARAYGLLQTTKTAWNINPSDEAAERAKYLAIHRLLSASIVHIDAAKEECKKINNPTGAMTLSGEPSRITEDEFYDLAGIVRS